MVRTIKYRDSIEFRDTFSRYVSWRKISGIAHYCTACCVWPIPVSDEDGAWDAGFRDAV